MHCATRTGVWLFFARSRLTLRLHLLAISNELEVERKASLQQKSAETKKRTQKEEEAHRKRMHLKQQQFLSKFHAQKENFEIYGAVTPLLEDCPDIVHSRSGESANYRSLYILTTRFEAGGYHIWLSAQFARPIFLSNIADQRSRSWDEDPIGWRRESCD